MPSMPAMSTKSTTPANSRLRLTLCLMLGAYPLITLILTLIGPLTASWPLVARTALVAPLMVFSMVYLITPAAHRLAGAWIRGEQRLHG
ncbi:MAG: hypothetical protein P4L98_00560 [Ancalomicrobiaceae bacterium]|nr:hypothetical protein [Ancalomicrobiaceae bacterium]